MQNNYNNSNNNSGSSSSSSSGNGNGTYEFSWGPDVYKILEKEESSTKRSIQKQAAKFSTSIRDKQWQTEVRCQELDIPVPHPSGHQYSSQSQSQSHQTGLYNYNIYSQQNRNYKKLSKIQIDNMRSLDIPWWIKDSQDEREGMLEWNELAQLYFAQSTMMPDNSTANAYAQAQAQTAQATSQGQGQGLGLGLGLDEDHEQGQGPSKRMRAPDGSAIPTSTMSEHERRLLAIREQCPLHGPDHRDPNTFPIMSNDVEDAICKTVQSQVGSNMGWYSSSLGKSIQKVKFGLKR